jgi:hypothetical protein
MMAAPTHRFRQPRIRKKKERTIRGVEEGWGGVGAERNKSGNIKIFKKDAPE